MINCNLMKLRQPCGSEMRAILRGYQIRLISRCAVYNWFVPSASFANLYQICLALSFTLNFAYSSIGLHSVRIVRI